MSIQNTFVCITFASEFIDFLRVIDREFYYTQLSPFNFVHSVTANFFWLSVIPAMGDGLRWCSAVRSDRALNRDWLNQPTKRRGRSWGPGTADETHDEIALSKSCVISELGEWVYVYNSGGESVVDYRFTLFAHLVMSLLLGQLYVINWRFVRGMITVLKCEL